MLNLIESDVVGFAGLTTRESAAVDGLTASATIVGKNRSVLEKIDMVILLRNHFLSDSLLAVRSTKSSLQRIVVEKGGKFMHKSSSCDRTPH
jgi:hypothetical protein